MIQWQGKLLKLLMRYYEFGYTDALTIMYERVEKMDGVTKEQVLDLYGRYFDPRQNMPTYNSIIEGRRRRNATAEARDYLDVVHGLKQDEDDE